MDESTEKLFEEPPNIDELFLHVIELDGAVRAQFLEDLPAEVKYQVERMLNAHHEMPADFLTPSLVEPDEQSISDPQGPIRVIPSVFGGYEIQCLIGEGGMGFVYRGHDLTLHRLTAIKLMKPELASSPKARQRFLSEARAAAAIRHENVVTIFQADEAGGLPFIAMEFLEGESLASRLSGGQSLSISESVRIAGEIADGLAAAHAKQLMHRDVKPDNIWLERSTERVKLLDFGLVRSTADDIESKTISVIGTPGYMAPEQALDKPLDQRSDLFSLGVVLYRMVTGRGPFHRSTPLATLYAIANSKAASVRSIRADCPPSLEQLIHQLLKKRPEQRPETANIVSKELKRIASGHSKAARGSWPPAAAVLGLIMLGTVVTSYLTSNRKAHRPESLAAVHTVMNNGLPEKSVSDTDDTSEGPISANVAPMVTDNYGLQFDGIDDAVFVPDLELPARRALTVECWVQPHHVRTMTFVDVRTRLGLHLMEGALNPEVDHRWELFCPGQIYGKAYVHAPSDQVVEHFSDRLVHLAAVYDTNSLTLFVDGQPQDRGSLRYSYRQKQKPVTNALFAVGSRFRQRNGVTIGTGSNPTWNMHGIIDEVRISSVARYRESFEPQRRFETDSSTIALYHFDQFESDRVVDSSGNEWHGTLTGATSTPLKPYAKSNLVAVELPFEKAVQDNAKASSRRMLSFDGEDDIAVIPGSFQYVGPMTLEAWLKPEELFPAKLIDIDGRMAIRLDSASVDKSSDHRWACWLDADENGKWRPARLNSDATVMIESEQMTHVATVYDGSSLALFINGIRQQKEPLRKGRGLRQKVIPNRDLQMDVESLYPYWTVIGNPESLVSYHGQMDEIRISTVARYTEQFVPKRRFEPDDDTLALYHCDETVGDFMLDSSGNGHHGLVEGPTRVPESK